MNRLQACGHVLVDHLPTRVALLQRSYDEPIRSDAALDGLPTGGVANDWPASVPANRARPDAPCSVTEWRRAATVTGTRHRPPTG